MRAGAWQLPPDTGMNRCHLLMCVHIMGLFTEYISHTDRVSFIFFLSNTSVFLSLSVTHTHTHTHNNSYQFSSPGGPGIPGWAETHSITHLAAHAKTEHHLRAGSLRAGPERWELQRAHTCKHTQTHTPSSPSSNESCWKNTDTTQRYKGCVILDFIQRYGCPCVLVLRWVLYNCWTALLSLSNKASKEK